MKLKQRFVFPDNMQRNIYARNVSLVIIYSNSFPLIPINFHTVLFR